jgi:hypothetical protein
MQQNKSKGLKLCLLVLGLSVACLADPRPIIGGIVGIPPVPVGSTVQAVPPIYPSSPVITPPPLVPMIASPISQSQNSQKSSSPGGSSSRGGIQGSLRTNSYSPSSPHQGNFNQGPPGRPSPPGAGKSSPNQHRH